jgi:peptidoglycan/LPS O-acetylase OafA/YrhL
VQGLGGVPLTVAALVAALSSVVATTPFAYLSWRFVETPFVRLGKSRSPRKPQVDAIINSRRQEA